jgi:hypothetical protein
MPPVLRLVFPLSAAVVIAGGVASADTPAPAAPETLFREGRASADAGDYSRACTAFTESLRLDPAPGTLLNLADCEEHLGRLASAWGHYLRLETVLPPDDERQAIARERASVLAARVPWIAITLAADTPRDARVFRDDAEIDVAHLAVPFPVDPGPHSVLVVAPGREARTMAVVAVERETVRVVVSLEPVVLHPPGAEGTTAVLSAGPISHPTDRPARSRTAWLVGAGGIASMGVATYFGGRALAERNVSDASCVGGTCANATSLGAYESARSDARLCDVALGIGVVALAVGGYLLLTSRGEMPARTTLGLTRAGLGGAW